MDETTRSRILVVDDCRDTVEIISTLLKILGHECRGAQTGAAAMEQAVGFEPDVVFLDLVMPDVSGFTVAQQLRAHCGGRPYMAALTGLGSPEDRARTREGGFDDHLLKPVDKIRLCGVVAKAAKRNRSSVINNARVRHVEQRYGLERQ